MKLTATLSAAVLLFAGACAGTPDAAPEAAPEAAEASESGDMDGASLAELMSLLMGEAALTDEEIAATAAAASAHPVGSMENPVRASGPPGQRAYLSRLNCPDGGKPAYGRQGSVGIGIYGFIVDAYTVQCPDGTEVTAFMDMYHGDYQEAEPLPGFTIDPPF